MAEQASATAIVPAPTVLEGDYMLEVRDFSASGVLNRFSVPVPSTLTADQASLMLRAAILKSTTWKDKNFATVLHAVMYADNYSLDIMAGDVYMAEEGRLSTTAGAKIKHAIGTGKIEAYSVDMTDGPKIKIAYKLSGRDETWEGNELIAKVSVKVRGLEQPIVYTAKLSEWFTGRNPNWRTRPAYMLRKNALSKAFEEVAPLGTEADEAPPVAELPKLAKEA